MWEVPDVTLDQGAVPT